jgi:hypothetical protein
LICFVFTSAAINVGRKEPGMQSTRRSARAVALRGLSREPAVQTRVVIGARSWLVLPDREVELRGETSVPVVA